MRKDVLPGTLLSHYDLSDPKLRAAWDKGQKDHFFPYGMSKDDVFARMANEVELFK